jgi:predicted nucleotidyltransferase
MFEDVLTALTDAHVRFVVTGGVAVALHGCERPAADLDLVVDPSPDNLVAVMTGLARLGFQPTIPLPLALAIVLRTMDRQGREVDLNRVYTIPFEALLQRAAFVSIGGRKVAIVSCEDLIAAKQRRGRDYDLDDVRLLQSR